MSDLQWHSYLINNVEKPQFKIISFSHHIYLLCLGVCLFVCIKKTSKRLNQTGPNFLWDLTWPGRRYMNNKILKIRSKKFKIRFSLNFWLDRFFLLTKVQEGGRRGGRFVLLTRVQEGGRSGGRFVLLMRLLCNCFVIVCNYTNIFNEITPEFSLIKQGEIILTKIPKIFESR